MNEKFKSKKSKGFGALLLITSVLFIFLGIGLPLILKHSFDLIELVIKTLIIILVLGLFVWIWTGTYYTIDKEKLISKCGPFRFLVLIKEIKTIRTDQNTIGGIIRPTLSWKCIDIEYGKYKTISISPENLERFINTLTDLNKEIKIKYSG
jgi:hypothetical protein